jgi:hypothetical protein
VDLESAIRNQCIVTTVLSIAAARLVEPCPLRGELPEYPLVGTLVL